MILFTALLAGAAVFFFFILYFISEDYSRGDPGASIF